jgi:hypothetical protein
MRTLRKFGLVAGIWLLSAAAVPAHADGLSKFEQLIKAKIPPGALTYKSSKPLGDNGFELDGVVVTPPPDSTGGAKAEPIKIQSIAVEDIDFDSVAKQAPPNYVRLHVTGIVVDKNAAAGVDLQQLAGLDKVTADLVLDYRLDPDKKTMTLNRFELNMNGLATLDLSMILDGVVVGDVATGQAMNSTTLRTASFVYDDHSLLGIAIPAAAKMQGSDPAALITMANAMLDGFRAGQGEPTAKVFDALESFLEDYKAPKGPLHVTFNPPPGTTVATVTGAGGSDGVIKALGLTVDYAGTHPQKADADPGPAQPGAASPAVPAQSGEEEGKGAPLEKGKE